jgi:Ca2+-binding RTX toxin-like protein
MAVIDGSEFADSLTGGSNDDVLSGLAGNDTLRGDAGDDTLIGGEGDDVLEGESGADVLIGGSGHDILNGGDGNDLLAGGTGNDSLNGGAGTDTIALTGKRSDFQIVEIVAQTDTTPGIYTLRDLRVGISTQEGFDQLSGIEIFRFGEGPELTLAQMLDRAPSAIELLGTPVGGPSVSETAAEGTVVAQLFATDPDPGDIVTFSFAPGGDAGGRLVIDGNLLRVARNDAFDHESATSHSVTVIATDSSGNAVSRTFDVAVEDVFEILANLSVEVPATATAGTAQLWDLATGGYVLTWKESRPEGTVLMARRVDGSGTPLSGPEDDQNLGDPFAREFLGVDAEGRAAFFVRDAARNYESSSSIQDGVERTSSSEIGYDEVRWVDVSSGQQVDSLQLHDAITSGGTSSPTYYSETEYSNSGGREGIDTTFLGYFDGYVIYQKDIFSESSGGNFLQTSKAVDALLTIFDIQGKGSSAGSETRLSQIFAARAGEAPILLDTLGSESASSGSSSRLERWTFSSNGIAVTGSNSNSSSSTSSSLFVTPGHGTGGTPFVTTTVTHNSSYAINSTVNGVSSGIGGSESFQESALLGTDGRFALPVFEPDTALVTATLIDTDHAAYITYNSTQDAYGLTIHHSGGSSTFDLGASSGVFDLRLDRIGDTGYIVGVIRSDQTGAQFTQARIIARDAVPVTDTVAFDGAVQFLVREDNTVVAYSTAVQPDGTQSIGVSALASRVLVTPLTGAFIDTDNDGDLDYSGVIFLGMNDGTDRILRLEGGTYELTQEKLTVTNATVYADIGTKTGDPMFVGSFTLDRATGIASGFVTRPLEAGVQGMTMGGLDLTYSGLTLLKDRALFGARLTLPTPLFGLSAIELAGPNSLEVTETGPQFGGYEFTIPKASFSAGLGNPDDWVSINLFSVEAKALKVRYDAALDEHSLSGEVIAKSDIVEALLALGNAEDAQLKFTDFKIREGLYDFAGEFSVKKWKLGPVSLKNLAIGVVVDDNVVTTINVKAGVELPFSPLNGLSFAGQVLRPPFGINAVRLVAETSVPLSGLFFLDSISAGLNNLTGSPPEPSPLPTVFSGGLGIGWGIKVPEVTLPDFLGIETIKEARPVNITMDITTDWSTTITGTGKLNVYKDELVNFGGDITWDYRKDTIGLTGSVSALGGLVSGTGSARVSELGVNAHAQVAGSMPGGALFGPLAGITLLLADLHVQYLEDADKTNDFKAVWGGMLLPVIGTITVGYKQDLNTLAVTPILGANDIPKTSSYDVDGTEDWLMITARWETAASGPVETRVRTPEGTFIAEADYAANGITLLAELTNAFAKTIVIDDPRAGNWDLQVIDGTGLGTITYNGYSPNPPATVEVTGATAGADVATGQITARITGADPGTRVTFWADEDAAGFDGFALGGLSLDADATVTFDFDTTLLSGGAWHIYAMVDDGRNAPAFDYLETPVTLAHRPTGISLDPATEDPQTDALISEIAAPGTLVGTLAVETPDPGAAHVLTLLDDAGGRFALEGDRIVLGSGAPLDADAGPYRLTIRATGPGGLSVDQDILIGVSEQDGSHRMRSAGLAEAELLPGGPGNDAFTGAGPGDRVIGGAGTDGLWLSGARADYEVIIDPTGAVLGPLSGSLGDGAGVAKGVPLAGPYVSIRLLGDPASTAITASGLEFLQFADQRIEIEAAEPGSAFVDSYDLFEDDTLSVPALTGLLANDGRQTGAIVTAVLVSGPSHGTLSLAADGSFTYMPDADFSGRDSFIYRTNVDGVLSDPVPVALNVLPQIDPPTIVSLGGGASAAISVSEGQVRLPSALATDRDGDPLTYALLGPDSMLFAIDPVTGALSFIDPPSFAAPGDADGDNIYEIEILVQDNGLSDTQIILVTVTEAPSRLVFDGTPGDDRAISPGVPLQANGLEGNDTLAGASGSDVLDGGSGNDLLMGRGGSDDLRGRAGRDTLDGGPEWDILDGGADADFVRYSSAMGAVTVDLAAGTGTRGDATGDILIDIENIIGSAFDDALSGDGGGNVLIGGDGNDTLAGRAGNDTLAGGAGADHLDGGEGTDRVDYSASTAGVTVDLAAGIASGGHAADDVLTGIENLTGSAHADTLTGNAAANVLQGGLGDDILAGLDGNDSLHGGDGNDTLQGAAGNDVLTGGAGADQLDGGAGVDRVAYGASTAGVTVDLAAGIASGGYAAGDVLTGIENLTGSAHADTLTGNAAANVLQGGLGDDILAGLDGNDSLHGGDGNDTLQGGAGNDALTGGAGADVFVLDLGAGRDRIRDLSTGDRILISADLWAATGAADTGDFLTTSAVQSGSSVLLAFTASDVLRIDNYSIAALLASQDIFVLS